MKYSVGDLVAMTEDACVQRPYKARICILGVILPFAKKECGVFYKNKYKVFWWPHGDFFITKTEDLKMLSSHKNNHTICTVSMSTSK
jgi:hypothetical protein